MRVLVTGGNRYIGLELVRRLAMDGHDVTVANSHEVELPDGVRRIHVDRRIAGALTEVLTPVQDDFDAVFDNTSFTTDDLAPMIELFRGRVQHFVFTSSTAVYRRSFVQPVREGFRRHDPFDDDPRKAYGVHKVRCEELLAEEHRSNGFPSTVLRVSHTLGPRSPLVTRDPIFFHRLEHGLPIFLPNDGFAFVSLVHVADVAGAMVSILGAAGAAGRTYNVAGTEVTSIAGVVHFMAKAVGVEANIVAVPLGLARRLRPPVVHWGEAIMGGTIYAVDALTSELGWQPRFGLEDGYRDSYEWFCDGGREQYDYDTSGDAELLATLRAGGSE